MLQGFEILFKIASTYRAKVLLTYIACRQVISLISKYVYYIFFSVHNRTLLWNFKDLKCLIGSDLPIFGDEDHPCVSLKLVNVKKPINILTGLDYWLDNLMCQVPEVLMCFHDEGIVKK